MEKKEAMKILKDFHDKSALFSVRTALDTIIPELKENEDEKIRKYLLSMFPDPNDSWDGISASDIIAWLEKKEFNKIEQNPAWSEEDEKMCQETIDWFEKKCFPYALESENPARESISWLKSLKERIGCEVNCTTTKAWSEENEYNFAFIQEALLGLDGDDSYREKCCKMAEWLESLKEKFVDFDKGFNVGFSAAKYNQWKPSDKQMKLLKDACDQHWEPDGLDPLYTLYQDLKKLKG